MTQRTYRVNPAGSTIVVQARTSVGPVAYQVAGVEGEVTLTRHPDGHVDTDAPVSGHVELEVAHLTSGNRVYDGELLRRIDARRHPRSRVEYIEGRHIANGGYSVTGAVEFHGRRVVVNGDLRLEFRDDDSLLVTGEHSLDIRDFDIPPPTMLMLKIYPDVRVVLVLEARPVGSDGGG